MGLLICAFVFELEQDIRVEFMMSSSDALAVVPAVTSGIENEPVHFGFDNTYGRLPERFYGRVDPRPVSSPGLIKVNVVLAKVLGLDPNSLASPKGVQILADNRVAEGSEPIALAYAGHQFGHFVPQLGDGRANLLGEVMGIDGMGRSDDHLQG